MKTTSNAFRLTYLAILTAIVIVLQMLGSFIRFGTFEVSLVLLPIVLGVVTCGPLAGAWLGLVFGVCVLVSPTTQAFMTISIFGTVVTVLLKGILCGLAAGYVFHLLKNKNRYLAVIAAAIVCPIVNPGIFLLGTLVFVWDSITMWAAGAGNAPFAFVILTLIGANFLFELLFNVVLSPIIIRLIQAAKLERFLK